MTVLDRHTKAETTADKRLTGDLRSEDAEDVMNIAVTVCIYSV